MWYFAGFASAPLNLIFKAVQLEIGVSEGGCIFLLPHVLNLMLNDEIGTLLMLQEDLIYLWISFILLICTGFF